MEVRGKTSQSNRLQNAVGQVMAYQSCTRNDQFDEFDPFQSFHKKR